MGTYWSFIGQTYPPAPTLTEKNLPDQAGKVFIVTGATSGVGRELAQILYSHNAKVYIGARSKGRALQVIKAIQSRFPDSKGDIIFLHLDLEDFATIKKCADDFLSKEDRLDVLWNNAAVMGPVPDMKTKQGALPLHQAADTDSDPNCKEIASRIRQSNMGVFFCRGTACAPGGLDVDNLDYKREKPFAHVYGVSKAGNVLHSKEYAKLYKDDGIVSLSLNPGNLKTGLQKNLSPWVVMLTKMISYEPIYGAYTELFAGLSPEITIEQSGAWIIPWGRIAPIRKDYEESAKTIAEGGTGVGEKFWEWSEEQVRPYL